MIGDLVICRGNMVQSVIWERSFDIESLSSHHLDRGPVDAGFLIAEKPVLASMGVER
jgi:hypothetical protein